VADYPFAPAVAYSRALALFMAGNDAWVFRKVPGLLLGHIARIAKLPAMAARTARISN
jgi:hypothetical protein